jgi:hypothetical protein
MARLHPCLPPSERVKKYSKTCFLNKIIAKPHLFCEHHTYIGSAAVEMAVTAKHVLSLMVFWGQIQNYMMRINLSILIVAMTKEPDIITEDGNDIVNMTCMENR